MNAIVPIALFIAYSTIFFVMMGSKKRNASIGTPLLLLPACGSFWTMTYLEWPPGLSSLWGLGLIVHVAHTTSILYLDKVRTPITFCGTKHERRFWADAFAVYRFWEDPQRLYWQVQPWSTKKRADRMMVVAFIVKRLLVVAVIWLAQMYFVAPVFPGAFLPFELDDFSPRRDAIFRRLLFKDNTIRITARETLLRLSFTLFWLWETFAVLTGANVILSIVFVAVRLDDPDDWPWIFGSPWEAYSIRRFWGRYWHRIVVPAYSSHARHLVHRIATVKPGSPAEKVLVVFGVFALSGMTHALCSWRLGDERWTDDFYFFLLNFAAAALEHAVQSTLERLTRSKVRHWQLPWLGRKVTSSLLRGLGYTWVCVFLLWSVPRWQYPKLQLAIEDSMMLW